MVTFYTRLTKVASYFWTPEPYKIYACVLQRCSVELKATFLFCI